MQADARESATDELYRLLDRLTQVLDDENAALRARDADALFVAVDNKRDVLRDLAAAWSGSRFGRLAHDADKAGPVPAGLTERLARIRTLNETAGGAIALLLHNTRESLGLLGMSPQPPAYGASGQGTTGGTGRALAIG